MHNHSSYALAKKTSNQVQVDWVRSNKSYARGKSPKELFFACFKLGGTVQLNLYLLLHDIFRVLVLFRRMTQKLWKLLCNFHFNCNLFNKNNLFYSPLLCIVRKERQFLLVSWSTGLGSCIVGCIFIRIFLKLWINIGKVKDLIKMLLTLLLTSMTLGKHRYVEMEKIVK